MSPIDIDVVRRIVPEFLEVLKKRVRILERIFLLQPIGRRALALEMQITERVLRAELDFLRQQGLLSAGATGVALTNEGESLLNELGTLVASMEGRIELAQGVSKLLKIPQVVVVEGDSDENRWVKDNLGYRAAEHLRSLLVEKDILAVTGGTTMAGLARMMPPQKLPFPIRVVPARGGLGETIDIQANSIAARLAEKLGGHSFMLHVPDRLGEEVLQQLLSDPYVEQRIQEIREATVVVHGIGNAQQMAERRQATVEEIALLKAKKAVAEAFGYYFNNDGKEVYAMTTMGLRLSDISNVRIVMAVAGGSHKAEAVFAAAKAYRIDVLVTDEGAAKRLLASEINQRGE